MEGKEMKNPPEFYGKEYLENRFGSSGKFQRIEDNGCYWQAAKFIKELLDKTGIEKPKTLDVGCGLGYIVRHLRNAGIVDAVGCEYGRWTQENAVVSGILWADLTEGLPYEDESFDFVSCLGVLSQFGERYAPRALAELRRVTRFILWTNIQLEMNHLQSYHKNIKPVSYWEELFKEAGFLFNEEADEFLKKTYPGVPEQFNRLWFK